MMAEQNTGTGNSQWLVVDYNRRDVYAETQKAAADLAYICELCSRPGLVLDNLCSEIRSGLWSKFLA